MVSRINVDDENKRALTYQQRSRNFFPGKTVFQVGGGIEYRVLDKFVTFSYNDVFNTAVGGLAKTDYLRQERTRDIERVSTYRPKTMENSLRAKIFNAGGGVEYLALDIYSYPKMEIFGTPI